MTDLPPRPTSEAVAAALIAAADGAPLLADHPVTPDDFGLQRITMANGWKLAIWWSLGQQMGPVHQATSPEGLHWVYGCARWPDWLAGPEAVVLDPIRHLLSDEQRERLRARLLSCSCWPEPIHHCCLLLNRLPDDWEESFPG
jgi:hypothetical protein